MSASSYAQTEKNKRIRRSGCVFQLCTKAKVPVFDHLIIDLKRIPRIPMFLSLKPAVNSHIQSVASRKSTLITAPTYFAYVLTLRADRLRRHLFNVSRQKTHLEMCFNSTSLCAVKTTTSATYRARKSAWC